MALKYLWHSQQQETLFRDCARDTLRNRFGKSAARDATGFCIYIDNDGDLVRVTSVSEDGRPATQHKDNRLVGVAKDPVCLVGNTGYFSDDARNWCSDNNIEPSLSGLLLHMGTKATFRTHTKIPVQVGKPLKLRQGAGA